VPKAIEPINESRNFAASELFFSTTDLKGRIQRANSVFRRIADYAWDDLENKPHNIIRHPDMPRVVFQLLWDYIQSGRPVVAYVKNLASDGRYYWVVAVVVPVAGGYLSVRFKPTSPLFATVRDLYAELRACEGAIESESKDRKAAIAASRKLLDKSLQGLGFKTYDDFMREAMKREMQSREAQIDGLAKERHANAADSMDRSRQVDSRRAAAQMFDNLLGLLSELFRDLESYLKITEEVRAKSETVTDVSESLRVLALNGALEADRLGADAAGMRPVLDWLRSFSRQITKEGGRLSISLLDLIQEVDLVVFGLSTAKLQIEMTADFAHELVNASAEGQTGDRENRMTEGAIGVLHASSCETVRRALGNLDTVKKKLQGLTEAQYRLLEASRSLRPIYLRGKIEMVEGAGPKLASIFKDVSEQLNEALSNLNALKSVLRDLENHLNHGLAQGQRVEESIAEIDSHVVALAV
jgi:aerotaxis receptor